MELFPEHYFSDYSLEGVTKEENQILMEVKADEMAKNLTQLKSSGSAAPKALKVNAWLISNVQIISTNFPGKQVLANKMQDRRVFHLFKGIVLNKIVLTFSTV